MSDAQDGSEAGTRLDPPTAGTEDPTVLTPSRVEGPGTVIGNYKLLEQIGEGGFGVVYLAEQTAPVKRRVALKIIKLGMDTKQVIGRFEAERQALAMMDHPNIAKVLDAGATDTGRPFFVMELVKGVPVTEYCDTNKLDAQRRLALFVDVCRAVQHAHQKGIIHRDLKPSNVLVTSHDGAPAPKVIDFGIAKATNAELTEKTVFTQQRQFIGTPAYMSPEQAEFSGIDIDTRSDIYSLGVMLYEVLTGITPFDEERLRSAALGEIQRIIRDEEPRLPSTRLGAMLSASRRTAEQSTGSSIDDIARFRRTDPRSLCRSLRGDLDWIVMRCLEKDRTRRYETANGLAADIERHLRDEPVDASPPGAGYRVQKFVRRNRALVTMGAAIAAVLVVATIVSVTAGVIAVNARKETDAQLAATESAQREAEAVTSFLSEMLASANPRVQGKDARVLDLVDAAGERIDREFKEQPLVEARLRRTLASTYQSLGSFEPAERHAKASLDLRRRILGTEDEASLDSAKVLAGIKFGQGRYAEARELLEPTLDACRRVLGEDHPLTLSAQSLLGQLHATMNEFEDAEAVHAKTYEQRRRVLGENHESTLFSLHWLALAIQRQGRTDEAEAMFTDLLDRRRNALGADHLDTLWTMQQLAILASMRRRHPEAQALHERILEGRRRIQGDDHPGTLWSMHYLGMSHRDQGRMDEAEIWLKRAAEGRLRILGETTPDYLWSVYELGRLYGMQGRAALAAEQFAIAAKGHEQLFGPEQRVTLRSMDLHGLALLDSQQFAAAVEVLERTQRGRSRAFGDEDARTLQTTHKLARAYAGVDREEDALEAFERILDVNLRTHGAVATETRAALNNLAYFRLNASDPEFHDPAEAVALARQACEGAPRPIAVHLGTLANALFETGDTAEAIAVTRRVLEIIPPGRADRVVYEELLRENEATEESTSPGE